MASARQHQDQQAERRREIAMHHLLDGLVILERPMRKGFIDGIDVLRGLVRGEMTVAARPVRAAQARGAQAYPRAEHDDDQREHHADQCEPTEQRQFRSFHRTLTLSRDASC